jgi:23S rRNA (adenine2503-C2)-methyltransferase
MAATNLKGMSLQELEAFALSIGEKKFRGRQLFHWLYSRHAADFAEMSTLSRALRTTLAQTAIIDSPSVVASQTSHTDGTTKFLLSLSDGSRIESVLIPPKSPFEDADTEPEPGNPRLTLCVSTQVGCPLDCAFCATATMGYKRNLGAGEIIGQVEAAQAASGRTITNLVYMGMGEPFLNYDEVMKSAGIFIEGFNIAAKRITISTAGLVPQIRRMADEGWKMKLAISLHTLDEAARRDLMPITRKYPLPDLIGAMEYFNRKTRRRVTLEYIPFDGWNDRQEDIERLAKLSRRIPCKINIIPFHSIDFTNPSGLAAKLKPTPAGKIEEFARRLRERHCTVFVRSSAGEDIDAACGQLAVSTPDKAPAKRHKTARKP